ncbi:LmeA family phospholipid-binding protein [Gordonia sp. FQ]|uniref:LmeA family phospholipid-binding protein n=1 Tax=Gordonia sp. FQ TaxID=3446634 RepID=UPI003F843825
MTEPTDPAKPTEPDAQDRPPAEPASESPADPAATTGPVDVTALPTDHVPVAPKHATQEPAVSEPEARPATRPVTAEYPAAGDSGVFAAPPADPASAPASSGSTTGTTPVVRTKRRLWRTVTLSVVAVLLLVVISGVGTELYLRHRVQSCLENAFKDMTGTSTDVSMPRGSMLLAWMRGEVAWVQVDTNDSGNGSAMRLHARATDVSSNGKTVRTLRGTAYVPYSRVKAMADEGGSAGGAPTIDSVTGSAADRSMTIDSNVPVAFLSVPATVVLLPTKTTDGKVEFQVKEAKAFGIGVPNDFAQDLVDQTTQAMLGPLFQEIQVNELTVSDQGIEFGFSGDDVNLQAASASTSGGGGKCT